MSANTRLPYAGGGVARRTLLKGSAVLAGAIAAPAIVSRGVLASSGEVNFMGWAGYDLPRNSRPSPRRPASRSTSSSSPTTNRCSPRPSCRCRPARSTSASRPSSALQAYVENGLVQPWDESKINLDGYEPGLVSGASRRDGGGRRQALLPAQRLGHRGARLQHRAAPMEYGTASLGDLFDPKYVGMVTVRPHSALAAMGRYLDSQGKLPHPFLESYTDMDVMRRTGTSSWPRRSRPSRTSPSSGRVRTRLRRRSAPTAACSASAGIRPASTCRTTACRSPISPQGRGVRLELGLRAAEEREERRAGACVRELRRHARGLRAARQAFRANPAAKGAIDLARPQGRRPSTRRPIPGDALSKLWWWPSQASEFLTLRNEYADKYQAA